MSEQAPEPARGRRENAFTRKIGPLPMWQWLIIALAMVGVYVIYQYRKNNQANANAANTAAGTATGGTAGAGQVPQFVNQTNTYIAPPVAPTPPPSSIGQVQPGSGPSPGQGGGLLRPTGPVGAGGFLPRGPIGSGVTVVRPWTGPNLRGLTLAQARQALQSYSGGAYSIQNVSGNQAGKIVSFTPYTNGTVNLGLS